MSRRPFNLSNAIWRCEFEDYRPINGPSPPVGPPTLGKRKWRSLRLPGDQLPSLYGKVTAPTPTAPLWTQDQAIAYEAALEAINDVIAGYSEQIALEHGRVVPNTASDKRCWNTARSFGRETAQGEGPPDGRALVR